MGLNKYEEQVLRENSQSLDRISNEEFDTALELVEKAPKIFVLALGRAGFAIKSFAMRLMHMGKDAYVVGETITPNFEKNDLLVIASGSGETKQFLQMAEKAQYFGGKVLALTGNGDSTLANLSDAKVVIPAPSKNVAESSFASVQPMASLYEQTVLLLGDSIVLGLMERSDKENKEMFKKHSNLE
ncbi:MULTISPECIES: 6-phospho-3-hexuloisomerase [Enterococcus]|uniref:6-phospho-3-hexuloisomerase n=1 Tax=Enterococcus TaxID=1350 RepID=UPI000ED3AC7F|nr:MULTISPECIES: 6-phospho-3-hexuloisomerase [Enterococcus]HCM86065.1 6-phospho-3-hexuloisomerase [Enterococcus sp.]